MSREKVFRDRNNPLDYMTDMELVQRFRFTRHSMEDLVDQVAPMIERPTGRSSAIPVSAFAGNCSITFTPINHE